MTLPLYSTLKEAALAHARDGIQRAVSVLMDAAAPLAYAARGSYGDQQAHFPPFPVKVIADCRVPAGARLWLTDGTLEVFINDRHVRALAPSGDVIEGTIYGVPMSIPVEWVPMFPRRKESK